QRSFFMNLPSGVNPQQANADVSGMANQLGMTTKQLFQTMTEAMPAARDLSWDQLKQSASVAAKIAPEKDQAGVMRGIDSLMEMAPGMSADQAGGAIGQLGKLSNHGIAGAWQSVIPAMAEMTGSDSMAQKGAFVSAIASDPRFQREMGGRSARTLA